MPGHWVLAGCAWIVSKQTDIQAFHDVNQKNAFWRAADFKPKRMPSYDTTYARLIEFAGYQEGIDKARSKLWHLACHRDPRVGRHVHIDATAVEAHARMQHACEDPEWCAANGGKKMPGWVEPLDVRTANKQRQNDNKEARARTSSPTRPSKLRECSTRMSSRPATPGMISRSSHSRSSTIPGRTSRHIRSTQTGEGARAA